MNKDKGNIEYRTILKYFENKASGEEIGKVTEWLGDPERAYNCEKKLHVLWDELNNDGKEDEKELEVLLDRIHHQIQLRGKKNTKLKVLVSDGKTKLKLDRVLRNLGRIAAIFLLPVMIYIGWEIFSQKMWIRSQAEVVYNEIKSPLGAQSQFELPDGTKGNLNNGSSLKYPAKFTGQTREVELKGEAYFDVEHNKQRPFIIKTAGLDIKVLGTRLNVYSYPDETYQEITLEEGSVELLERDEKEEITVVKMEPGQHVVYNFGENEPVVSLPEEDEDLLIIDSKEQMDNLIDDLKPGQQTMLNTEEGALYLQVTDTENYTGWTDGKLILRNDPMPLLLKRMERWYNVKFNIIDERVKEYTYWATFEEEKIDQVLMLLSLTGPVKFKMHPRKKNEDGTFIPQEIDVYM